jgi:hypothetical protein
MLNPVGAFAVCAMNAFSLSARSPYYDEVVEPVSQGNRKGSADTR